MIYTTDANSRPQHETAITLGNFDGVHKGHQKLIETVKSYGRESNLHTLVFSFYPHPQSLMCDEPFQTILSSDEKLRLLQQMDVAYFTEYPFTQDMREMEPAFFVEKILHDKMKCKAIVIGEDYRFGKNKTGTCAELQALGRAYGISVFIVPHVVIDGEKVSSSNIRNKLLNRKFDTMENLMGRPYFIQGEVAYGKQIGRTIGFPTANIIPSVDKLLPPNGVYVTKTQYNGHVYSSITNIGTNPTVNGDKKVIETFLFDFDEYIYGEEICVHFYKWLRGEMKFSNIEKLKEQIQTDIKERQKP